MRKVAQLQTLALLMLLVLIAVPAFAQEQTASIQGQVTDSTGAALPGVMVTAVSQQGVTLTTYTDASGRYRFPSVPPGEYTMRAELAGMEGSTVENLGVRLGQSPKIDMTLSVSAVTEAITVTSTAPLVDTTSSATATSMSSETFEKLPLGRDFTSVVALAAGANNDPKAGGITIDGASGSENVFVLDGVNVTDPDNGVSGKVIITDTIEEVQVKSAGYAAEYGGAIGGVINVITKSGTNDWSGTVGAYYRDEDWNGDLRPNLVLDSSGAGFDYEQYPNDDETRIEPGFTIGGPIARDRMWFFAAYEPLIIDTDRRIPYSDGSTDVFSQEFQRDNAAATMSGTIGSNLIWKLAGNNSGYDETNALPGRGTRSDPDQADYVGQNEKGTNWTASGYMDYVATQNLAFSLRGGRFLQNVQNEGFPTTPQIWFYRGAPSEFPEITDPAILQPNGWTSGPTPLGTDHDKYTRDNLYFDASWYPNIAGSHAIKAGIQFENLENDILDGYSSHRFLTFWNRPTRWISEDKKGPYGAVEVYGIQTVGVVESKNTALFIQDSWTTMDDRLTLNIGLRAEQEKVPNYADPSLGLPAYAVEFDFDDKIAPRLGFAYDITGDGTWKTYGSYGTFYDIMKLEAPRGSFGGDKWISWSFAINDPDWRNWNCTGVQSEDLNSPPSCQGLSFVSGINLRAPSLDLIEPNLKPMESEEYTLGLQHELSSTMAVGLRYVHKELIRTIEDVGVLVEHDGSFSEEYFMANPGEGIATKILGPNFPAFPKPVREYDAIELDFNKRFSGNWSLYANYVYSKLYGNYSGLANSDEALNSTGSARTSPNVNRFGDSLFNMFDASGSVNPVLGRLSTDRPHQFKAQVIYSFPIGTTISANQYIGSGTPISSEFEFHGVPFFGLGRGDLGRTSTLTQTDLYLEHEFPIFGNYGLELGVNILNLFDEDTETQIYNLYSEHVELPEGPNDGDYAGAEAFFDGFDPFAASLDADPRYGQAIAFQDPREVRFHVKLRF